MARQDAAGSMPGVLRNCLGEVVPGAYAFVGVVVDIVISTKRSAWRNLIILEDGENDSGKVTGIGGRTNLVEDNLELRP